LFDPGSKSYFLLMLSAITNKISHEQIHPDRLPGFAGHGYAFTAPPDHASHPIPSGIRYEMKM
jgi:hypothetical protein